MWSETSRRRTTNENKCIQHLCVDNSMVCVCVCRETEWCVDNDPDDKTASLRVDSIRYIYLARISKVAKKEPRSLGKKIMLQELNE